MTHSFDKPSLSARALTSSSSQAQAAFTNRRTKRSNQVSLVLLGSLALWGCSKTDTYQYANKQDCVKDWGETECEQQGERRRGGYFFYANAARFATANAHHAQSVKRGGFGSRFSSGRS